MERLTRILLVGLLMIVLAASVAAAEILKVNQNRGGFFIGLNFANQGGDMEQVGNELAAEMQNEFGGTWTSSKGANLGLGIGGYYVIQTTPTFGIEIEGQYVRRGSKIELMASGVSGVPSGTEIKSEFQINYLEVPVLARFSPSPAAKVRPVFLVGPVLGIKTGANLKMTIEGESQSQNFSDEYESINFGLLGGVGISAQVSTTGYFVVQARYFLGLTDPISESTISGKSSDFGVFVGMEFTPK